MQPTLTVEVEMFPGSPAAYVVEAKFSRLNPIPLEAHERYFIALASGADNEGTARGAARNLRASSELFDECCVAACVEGIEIGLDKVSHHAKFEAIQKLRALIDARVKEPGQSSNETSR